MLKNFIVVVAKRFCNDVVQCFQGTNIYEIEGMEACPLRKGHFHINALFCLQILHYTATACVNEKVSVGSDYHMMQF